MSGPPATYTREEMDAILERALERQQAKSEGISREELVAAAGEAGISREDVEAAAREIDAKRARDAEGEAERREAMELVDSNRAVALRRLLGRAVWYGAITAICFAMCFVTHATWWLWVAFGLGISLAATASKLFFADPRTLGLSRREQRRLRRAEKRRDFDERVAVGADAIARALDASRAKARVADPRTRVDAGDEEPEASDRGDAPASTRTSKRS
jgi:hypothetical protein